MGDRHAIYINVPTKYVDVHDHDGSAYNIYGPRVDDDGSTEMSPVTFDNCVPVCSPSTADINAETIVESQLPSQGNGVPLPQQPTKLTASTSTTETIARYPRRNRKPREWFKGLELLYSGLLYVFIVHVCIHFMFHLLFCVIGMC